MTSYELRVTSGEGPALTGGQLVVLGWLARGVPIREAARRSCYSLVHTYELLRGAREALGVETNVGAVVVAVGLGLMELPGVEEVKKSDE